MEDLSATLKQIIFITEFLQKNILHQVITLIFDLSTIAIQSNGVFIAEVIVKKWYFLALEYDKPFLGRP